MMDNIKTLLKIFALAVIPVCFIVFFIGYNKGKREAYAPARIEARKSLEAQASDLQQQIKNTTENYDKQILSLQEKNTSEIDILERRNLSAIDALKREQAASIDKLIKDHENSIGIKQAGFTQELIAERNAYYIKGQVDARNTIQNQIDEKVRINASQNDWNAPVFSIKR
ncbi:MAG: hypothetical protein FWF26_05675 [Treponema sp.]|nr:hypothetical protein [Treponema sp.]